jgi:hypothetical protein
MIASLHWSYRPEPVLLLHPRVVAVGRLEAAHMPCGCLIVGAPRKHVSNALHAQQAFAAAACSRGIQRVQRDVIEPPVGAKASTCSPPSVTPHAA